MDKSCGYCIENNFAYHSPKDDTVKLTHENIRSTCRQAADTLFLLCPDSAERTLALRKLEEAMFWGNAAVARNQDKVSPGEDGAAREEEELTAST